MSYPDDFDTSAFIAGKRIALSRTGAVWVMVSFFLVIACCVALPWLQKNMRINPFIIHVNGPRGIWHLVGHDTMELDIPYYQSVQRAVVGVFTQKWFTISGNENQNEKNWGTCSRTDVCNRTVANTAWNDTGCEIYCMAGENMYQDFTSNVLPLYKTRVSFGERWYIDPARIAIRPNGNPTQSGGSWVVNATVRSNLNGDFNIIAYVKVARDVARYPQTLGYYITGFNSYRVQ